MKELLSQAGVAFEAFDVDEDPEAYDRLIALGFRTIPVTFVDGTPITGFNEAALRAALGP